MREEWERIRLEARTEMSTRCVVLIIEPYDHYVVFNSHEAQRIISSGRWLTG
jgi:hypothetical protein